MEFDLNRPWLTLDPWQKDYIATPPEVDCFMLVPRQIGGKTTAMSIKAVEMCINNFKEGEMVLINCLTERQAMLMLKKAEIYAEEKYEKFICRDRDNKPTMHRLMFKCGKLNKGIICYAAGEAGDSTRGYTIKKLMVDEGSRMKEDYFVSALPTLSLTKGSMDIASTPFGKKDKDGNEKFFYKCFKDETFKKFIVNMEDCPRRDIEMIEKMRKRLSRLQFAQEFENVFTDELSRIFSKEWIESVCVLDQSEVKIDFKAKKYLGVDVAGFGLDECTYEGFQKISKENIEQIDHIIERRNYTTDTSRRIFALNEIRNYKKIGIDDGGVGFGVFSELMNDTRTKRKTTALNNASRDKERDEEGKISPIKLLKEEMYMNLIVLGENKKIKLFKNNEVILSLESMQYGEDGKIFGSYSHICEGIIRGAWLAEKDKSLNIFVHGY